MRMLSRDELRRTRLETTRVVQAPAAASSSGTGQTASHPVNDGARNVMGGPRGWVIAQRAGSSTLVRRHPLTIEGDDIGTFEVALGCGRTSDSFVVSYAETRKGADEGDAPAVKQVDLWVDGKMATLDVLSSRLDNDPKASAHALETRASGTLSADAVKSFADAANDSITVRTVSTVAPGTLIRVGNTGFATAFRKLAASCHALPVASAEAHAELNPPRGGQPTP